MRGERATMGKSLLDVQRELRIKASYIAAIENCDPSAFDTPGFIAGYVRSYARYLGMDPDECFNHFCAESGFSVAHGMSDKASTIRKPGVAPVVDDQPRPKARDPFQEPRMAFVPAGDSFFSRIEPGAIGSMLVLVALIGGIGYGGWSVLREVQRVQLAPVDQTPVVLSELDPLAGATEPADDETDEVQTAGAGVFSPPRSEAMDRLYRPQALDVPVLVARDAPISSLDPSTVGAFASRGMPNRGQTVAPDGSERQVASLTQGFGTDAAPQTLPSLAGQVTLVAVRPAWVRVRGSNGGVLYERVMNAGDTWQVPAGETDPSLNVGESGAVYFAVNGQTYGPVGATGTVTRDLGLDPVVLTAAYQPADPGRDEDLQSIVADLGSSVASVGSGATALPKVLADNAPGVMMIAVRPAWVRVRAADGSVIYEATMNAGDTYKLPATDNPATLRVGESGAIYFAVNGQTYGPAGPNGQVTSNLALSVDNLTQSFAVADASDDRDLGRVVAELADLGPRRTD
ncbi:hypothetical protein GCM10011415_23970 [Salipiger pallidus]|uniref:Cytoskeleton protein RodZ-like C-terminal domain-containing protein n=2 Tax=Salipiger pallidus TaxID=1775170 RepID=A0A8J2ZK99_9RHOB|nr:hypothetical protein GCM10011415_23970 [Salipiger pallidus]